jgi:hypothetical protein
MQSFFEFNEVNWIQINWTKYSFEIQILALDFKSVLDLKLLNWIWIHPFQQSKFKYLFLYSFSYSSPETFFGPSAQSISYSFSPFILAAPAQLASRPSLAFLAQQTQCCSSSSSGHRWRCRRQPQRRATPPLRHPATASTPAQVPPEPAPSPPITGTTDFFHYILKLKLWMHWSSTLPWELINIFIEFVSLGDSSRRMFDDGAGIRKY